MENQTMALPAVKKLHGVGRVISAPSLEVSVSRLLPASAIIYDVYTSIKKSKV